MPQIESKHSWRTLAF